MNYRYIVLALLMPAAAQADTLAGYLVDSSGQPVRAGSGGCIRTSSWSAEKPGAGCDVVPDRIVLLPGPDGKAGAVVVRSAAGETLLDKAYAGVESSAGRLVSRQENAASVHSRYATTLDARPPRPVSYTVHFVSGSYTQLAPESQAVLEQMKAALAARPAPEIMVIGHTDTVGKLETNDLLSLKRAETVRDILVAAGVRAGSLDASGRGEREPLVVTADEVDEASNRRVEISVR